MNSYWSRQYREISESRLLRFFGFFLTLTHLWTFFLWVRKNFFVVSQSSQNGEPLCFPMFPNCDLYRAMISTDQWTLILYSYLFLTLLTLALYLSQRFKTAYGLLILVSLFKLTLHLSNYALMGNYHYMAHFIALIYLFLPHKKTMIMALLVGFYVAAGLLKINIEWLSGAAMIAPPYLKGAWLTVSLFYVVFLEIVFVWGLLHPNRWLRQLTLVQFLAFHLFSWHIVGFFYPLVMLCLLSLCWMQELSFFRASEPIHTPLKDLLRGKLPKSVYGVLVIFAFLQVLPFGFSADPSLSGAPRLSSLNMFDAYTECQPLIVIHQKKKSLTSIPPLRSLGVRLKCDPLVFLNQAHQLCRQAQDNKQPLKMDIALFTKRMTDLDFKKVLDIRDACEKNNLLWAEFGRQGAQ